MMNNIIVITVILICISVMFVKQHSFIDVISAIPLGIVAYILVFTIDRHHDAGYAAGCW